MSGLGGREEGDGGDKRELHFGYGLEDRERSEWSVRAKRLTSVRLDILYERKGGLTILIRDPKTV